MDISFVVEFCITSYQIPTRVSYSGIFSFENTNNRKPCLENRELAVPGKCWVWQKKTVSYV